MVCRDRICIVDVDDTLLAFHKGFSEWMEARGHKIIVPISQAKSIDEMFGFDHDTSIVAIREFYRDPAFGKLEPLDCAATVIPKLHEQGYRFVAITACEQHPVIEEARRRNLYEVFGFEFDEVHLTGLFVPKGKEPYLARYQPTVFVDDNFDHCVSGAVVGHQSLLIDHNSNRGRIHGNVHRVSDWHEIALRL